MGYIIGILIAIIILFMIYLIKVQSQIRNMGRQLETRIEEHTRQPISLALINKDLNQLAANINHCLKAEETLRLNGIREEKKFKEMIADISHDLRTPLTAITGYQQLLDKGELNDDQRKKLQVAMRHSHELGQLIEHFFEYSYLINTETKLELERFNLTQLLTECLVASITTFEEKQLIVHFDEDTPAIYVNSDKQKITRILQNLIRNCIQHSDGDIMVSLKSEKDTMISFNNPVKRPEDIDVTRLFDRFYSGDRARSRSTGLGLAIIKLLAQQLGGSVDAILEKEMLEIRVLLPKE